MSRAKKEFEVSLSEVTKLVVELIPSHSDLIGLSQLAAQLKVAGWLMATAQERVLAPWEPALEHHERPPWADHESTNRGKCRVTAINYGPPLVIGLTPPEHLLGNLSAVALVIYGIKRIWGVQTELRNHRAEIHRGLSRAREIADQVEMEALPAVEALRTAREMHRDRSRQDLDSEIIAAGHNAKAELGLVDLQHEWANETCFSIERQRTQLWRGRSAVWTWD